MGLSPRAPEAPVVRVRAKIKKPYNSFAKRHRAKAFTDHTFFSIVNDGTAYKTDEEKRRLEARKNRARWIHDKNFKSAFGVASKMSVRAPGGIVASGPYRGHADLAIARVDDKSRHVGRTSWRPIPDRKNYGARKLAGGSPRAPDS